MIDQLESERLEQSKLKKGAEITGGTTNGNTGRILGDEMTIYTEEFEDDLLGFSSGGDKVINEESSWAINKMLDDHMEAIALNDPKPENGYASPPVASTSKSQNEVSSPAGSANGSEAASRCASSIVSSSSNLFVELVNQKSYLEELLSNRDSKIEEMKLENGKLVERLSSSSSETDTLASQYEDIILELQQQVMDLQQQLSVAKKLERAVMKTNKNATSGSRNQERAKKNAGSSALLPPAESSRTVRKTGSDCVKKVVPAPL